VNDAADLPIMRIRFLVTVAVLIIALVQIARWIFGSGLSKTGLIVIGVLLAGFVMLCVLVGRSQKQIQRKVEAADRALAARDYSECLRLCDSALAIVRKMNLCANDVIAMTLVVRSEASQKLGKNDEALEAAAQAFGCLCAVQSGLAQIAILDRLGYLLVELRQEQRAIPVLETMVDLCERADPDPIRITSRLEHLGMAYLRVGVHAKSVAAFGKAIDTLSKHLGPDAAGLASPYFNLGNGYKHMQKMEDAERCYREALRIYDANNVKDVAQYSIVLLNLGVVCAESGRNEDAERYYQQVLEMRLAALGSNDWRVGNTYNNLAMCRLRARDFESAERYIQSAIGILEEHPEWLSNALATLSLIREDQGRVEEALAAAMRAREVQQNLTTPNLSELAVQYDREAMLASRIGDAERAAEARSRAAQQRQELASVGPRESDAANMGEALRTLDERLQASIKHVQALQEAV
jgi:tetratricopeptide (TPR) repeat protein